MMDVKLIVLIISSIKSLCHIQQAYLMLSVNCKSIKNIYYAAHAVPHVHPLPLERNHIARSVTLYHPSPTPPTDIQGQFVGLWAGRGASISAAQGHLLEEQPE